MKKFLRNFLLPVLFLAGCNQGDDLDASGSNTNASPQTSALQTKSRSSVWLVLKDRAALERAHTMRDWKSRGDFVYNELKKKADSTQAPIRALLDSRGVSYRSFWIVNAIKVDADAATLDELKKRTDIAKILPDRVYKIPEPIKEKSIPKIDAAEWGLTNIHAPEVWSTYGVKGEGIVVASIDTGVQYDHPAVARKYRGRKADGTYDHSYNWFDPGRICGGAPCDNIDHGTHTMGTMVGDDGDPGTNQIGVAPHAQWIAAKGCEDNSGCTTESLIASGQWMVAPTDAMGNNPRPDLRPNVVNNSWGGGGSDDFYTMVVDSWVAAGIFPSFSNGNSGPSCGSAGAPGDYPNSYGVGAYDVGNVIASFSSRGTSFFGMIVKPDISAPGVSVRSSVPGSGYASFSGTSMAAPHVSGAVALLWSAAPSLVGDIAATRTLLNTTAVPTSDLSCGGTADFNNVWGHGRLNVLAAVTAAPRGPTGTLAGTVTGNGAPVSGAAVKVTGPFTRATATDTTGRYSLLLPVGTYNAQYSAFGFVSQNLSGVSIRANMTTTQNVVLQPAPSHSLSGVVTDSANQPLAGVAVTILSTPLAPTTTDASGRYLFAAVPDGEYDVQAAGSKCLTAVTQHVTIASNTTKNFALAQMTDAYGYSCSNVTYNYIQANTALPLTGDDSSTAVQLPFPFSLYGQTYTAAQVSTNGFLTFLAPNSSYTNVSIPDPSLPNAAIYPFWDDLMVDSSSSVRTEAQGVAPNRTLTIEWRNVAFRGGSGRASFEVVLYENGRILMQYADVGTDARTTGSAATVGIENESGTVAFQYGFKNVGLSNQLAVLYKLPPSGFIEGVVSDANDGKPLAGAVVRALSGSTQVRAATTDKQGSYRFQIPVGSYAVEASFKNYASQTVTVNVQQDAVSTQNFALDTPVAIITPTVLEFTAQPEQVRTRVVTIKNGGKLPLTWRLDESGGARVATTFAPAMSSLRRNAKADPQARTTADLYLAHKATGWSPTAPGQVLKSFPTSTLSIPFGVGFASNVWIADAVGKTNQEYTPEGVAGRNFPATWAGSWPGDMAYDSTHNRICQVNVGGDNGIYCWDPATGMVVDSITGSNLPWAAISQRGLAYRDDDDSFYIGGWNEGIIYHIKGFGASDKGAVIATCSPPDQNISGLAYNSAAKVLWEATNSATDTIYELNPDNCNVVASLPHPAPGNNGGGLEIDNNGNLWMISQSPATAYLVDSGVPSFADVPWLWESPSSGTLKPGASVNIGVSVNTFSLTSGVYTASLFVQSNGGRQNSFQIPVSLLIPTYTQSVNAGGEDYVDLLGDSWVADQAYTAGGWGYLEDHGTAETRNRIAGTNAQAVYRSQRINPYAYKFDNLPNGTYEVELGFAEFDPNHGLHTRLFEVIIKDTLVLPALDITYDVGNLNADIRTFYVQVTDGKLDIRFIPLGGSEPPVVNAIRVTQRPDRH